MDADDEAVPSPCTRVCKIDPFTTWCAGCLRTMDEIATWSGLSSAERREVLERVAERGQVVLPGGARAPARPTGFRLPRLK